MTVPGQRIWDKAYEEMNPREKKQSRKREKSRPQRETESWIILSLTRLQSVYNDLYFFADHTALHRFLRYAPRPRRKTSQSALIEKASIVILCSTSQKRCSGLLIQPACANCKCMGICRPESSAARIASAAIAAAVASSSSSSSSSSSFPRPRSPLPLPRHHASIARPHQRRPAAAARQLTSRGKVRLSRRCVCSLCRRPASGELMASRSRPCTRRFHGGPSPRALAAQARQFGLPCPPRNF